MSFKYSVCYPNKSNIEYFNTPISKIEVLDIAKNDPWEEQLNINGTNYNPSLDFTSLKSERSFCLTAHFNKNKGVEFSLWYNRPKKVKILFGLFGEKEKMIVDDIWSFNIKDAITYLQYFVDENYLEIEKLYR